MSFATARQEKPAAHRGFHPQAAKEPPKKFCEFRHEIGQRLIAGSIRIDDAIEEVIAHVAGNPDGCAEEFIRHLRETSRWLLHPALVRNQNERRRAITLITRRSNRRVYNVHDLPR